MPPDPALLAAARARLEELGQERPDDLVESVAYGTWDGRPTILALAMPRHVQHLHQQLMQAFMGTPVPTTTVGVVARFWAAQDVDSGIECDVSQHLQAHMGTAGLAALGIRCHARGIAELGGALIVVEARFENVPASLNRKLLDRATRASAQALAEDLESPEDVVFPVGRRWFLQGVMLNAVLSDLVKRQQASAAGHPSGLLFPDAGRLARNLADRHGAHGPERL